MSLFSAAIQEARGAILAAIHPDDATPILAAIDRAEEIFVNRAGAYEALLEEILEAHDWYREHEKAIRAAGIPSAPDFMVPF